MATYSDFTSYNMFSIQNILLIIAFVILTCKVISMFILFRKYSGIPGPKGNPIIGNLLELKNSKDGVQTLANWARTYGPILAYRPLGIFGPYIVLITDADAIKQIMVTNSFNYEKPPSQNSVLRLGSKGLARVNGKEHSRQKRMINPAFRVSNLKGMVDVFKRKTKLLVQVWTNIINSNNNNDNEGTSLPVQTDMFHLTLDAIGECIFSYQFNSVTEGQSVLSTAFTTVLKGLNLRENMWKNVPILKHIPTKNKKIEEDALNIISNVILEIIHKKHEKRRNEEFNPDKKKDLLDLLMEAFDEDNGQRMSEEELHSQVWIFMLAGHETSSVTLCWTLYFLALYPEIQEKVRREIEETLKDDESPEWDTFDSMEYLAAVINESMRLRPPVAVVARLVAKEDDILGYKVPAGSLAILSPYILHRNPKYWKDPETFNPNRFLAPDKDDNPHHRYAFIPFAAGPRMCIGYRFALMEIKVVLSILLQNFSFLMIPGRSFECELAATYKPKPSLELLVQKL